MQQDYQHLRTVVDSNDQFMSSGHQIIKTAGATQHANRMLRVPVWAKDNNQIQEILLRVFPKLKDDPKQREQAAKWAMVINLYYRMGMTAENVGIELKISRAAVEQLLVRINRAAKGNNTDGVSYKRRGRPPKNRVSTD